MSPERKFEQRLVALAKKHGFFCRKAKWIGRNGAPDRMLIDPLGAVTWVELKSPGKEPTAIQLREHMLMRQHGQTVVVIDSMEGVEALFT